MSLSVIPDSKCVRSECVHACVHADSYTCMYMFIMRNEDKVQFIYH